MKKFYSSLVFAVVCHTALCIAPPTCQDSTARTIGQDTTAREETIFYGPSGKRKVRSLGYYTTTVDDPQAFRLSSGVGIFNVLRGHVPNAEISPSALYTSMKVRGRSPLLVIDGLPVSMAMTENYNFNSFEYQSISAISSGNAVAGIYGGSGMGGALLIRSKTGENYDQATIEANSYATIASRDLDRNNVQQWVLSNAVAYRQDFGKIDTRISCNYTLEPSPSGDEDEDTDARYYAFRINSGAAITKRFNARIILDSYYKKKSFVYQDPYSNGTYTVDGKGHRKLLQGNLALTYQVLDWLKVSAQGALSKIENDDRAFSVQTFPNDPPATTVDKYNWDQKRSFMNFFISADRKLSTDLSLTAFTGFQYEKYNPVGINTRREKSGSVDSISYKQRLEIKTKSWLNGLGLNYREIAFADLTYRRDQFPNDHGDTYSVSGSFVFSEAFHLTGAGFSSGRIRGSFGETDAGNRLNYPYEWQWFYDMSSLAPVAGKNFETGTDLGFVNNRIILSFSYFKNIHENTYAYIPGFVSGYTIEDKGKLKTSGWEVALGTIPFKNENVQLDTKLNWTAYTTTLNGGLPPPYDGSDPDWRSSLLNQFTWKNLFFSFLIDLRKGGTFQPELGSPYYWIVQDGTKAKLRDVSVGINLIPALPGREGIKEAKLSLSGRNLLTIYSQAPGDVEGGLYQRSGSVSLSLLF